MNIYIDAPKEVPQLSAGDFCSTGKDSILSIAGQLHKRAKCYRFSWMSISGYGSLGEFINRVFKLLEESSAALSPRDKRDMKSFVTNLLWVDAPSGSNALYAASCGASLVWVVLKNVDKIINSYGASEGSREVVSISKIEHLQDDAVCRVLYCNHPEVQENADHKGYVSQPPDDKHFLDTNNAVAWVENTGKIANGYGEKVSKFRPGITLDSEGYKKLERSAILDAMRKGKYSLEWMRGHVYTHDEDVGASDGEMTHKVCIDTCNRDVHLYPVS